MKAGIWYDMEEKCPPKSGYYLAFKGMSIGDDETASGYYYWNARRAEWLDSNTSMGRSANVIYWTEADPEDWYEKYSLRTRAEITAAEKDAWAQVEQALERYEIVRALAKK
jgi:hypothetical protein